MVAEFCDRVAVVYAGRVVEPVSYTHLDVYKRQVKDLPANKSVQTRIKQERLMQ